MAPDNLWPIWVLLLCTGLFVSTSEGKTMVTATQSGSHMESNEISAYVEPKEHLRGSLDEDKPKFSPKSLEPALTDAVSKLRSTQHTTDTKYENGNSSGIIMIEKPYSHGSRQLQGIRKNLQEISEQTTNYVRFFRKNVDMKANAKGAAGGQIDTQKSQNSATNLSSQQARNEINILDHSHHVSVNTDASFDNNNVEDKISNTEFKFTANYSDKKHNFNTVKKHNMKQLLNGHKNTVVILSNKNLEEVTPVPETKRFKRCVDKECEDKNGEMIQSLNDLKQLPNGSNMGVTETASENVKENRPARQEKGSKKCDGKMCKNNHKKDDCKGVPQEHCKDTPETATPEEKVKLTTLQNVLKFGVKEAIGLAMIFLIACTLIYTYMTQGYTDDVRRYVAFGTLCFFLLSFTVLSEMVDRAMDAASNAASA